MIHRINAVLTIALIAITHIVPADQVTTDLLPEVMTHPVPEVPLLVPVLLPEVMIRQVPEALLPEAVLAVQVADRVEVVNRPLSMMKKFL